MIQIYSDWMDEELALPKTEESWFWAAIFAEGLIDALEREGL